MEDNKHLVRGKDIKMNIWVEDSCVEIIRGRYYISYGEVDAKSVGKFTGLTEDEEFADYTNYLVPEPRQVFEGDILDLVYDDKVIRCVVAWEICGFLLGSHDFEDSFVWLTDVMESVDGYHWIKGANIIGNKVDNPELLK